MLKPFKLFVDFILFTSIFIAFCAIMMVYETNTLLHLRYDHLHYFSFVGCATLCSYNFHWWLTPENDSEMIRMRWTRKFKTLHLILFIAGMIGAIYFFFFFLQDWFWMAGVALLTFLYSAPKLPYRFASVLRKIAIGKTIFLAMVWTYVTTALPIFVSGISWSIEQLLFCLSKFFLIYAICIIFDYRDRDWDKKEGVRSLITFFNERQINLLFYISLLCFAVLTIWLGNKWFTEIITIILLVPGIVVLLLFPTAKRNFSDYLYYGVLDGLMMFSALLISLLGINYF